MAKDVKKDRFVTRLERAINASDKTQLEIAESLGYSNANLITMIKKGTTRLPLDKVVPMARELDLDPSQLMREWFAVYMPDALPSIESALGYILSASEKSWIDGLRKNFGTVPPYDTSWSSSIKAMTRVAAAA
jgi:transcriptional regulator with XRE-family HTH domain